MEMLDRMELADIGNPRLMAEGVIKLLSDVVFPMPVHEVAFALGIRTIEEIETTSFEGALLSNESKSNCAILVRAGVLETRRRFTIGHELGHYLMPLHFPSADGFKCTKSDMSTDETPGLTGRPQWEAQANTFSSELLMPRLEFKRRLRLTNGPSIESLIKLSNDFGVSRVAAGRIFMQLSDDPCAIIVAKNQKVEAIYRSQEFPYISLRRGFPLPRGTTAYDSSIYPSDVSDVEDADQSHWLSYEKRNLSLCEQTLFQADGWTLTLLTTEIDDEEDE
jgi:Zn-dependent peptidase ImmA (M78 family)